MTSKQRAYLKGLAMRNKSDFPDWKVKRNSGAYRCSSRGPGGERAHQAERSEKLSGRRQFHRGRISRENPFQVVQVIGKKIVLYKPAKDEKKKNCAAIGIRISERSWQK